MAQLAAVRDESQPKRARSFARSYGLLLSVFEPRDSSPGEVGTLAESARLSLRRLVEALSWLDGHARLLAEELESRRAPREIGRLVGGEKVMVGALVDTEFARRHWWAHDLSDARLDELRQGTTWKEYGRLIDQLRTVSSAPLGIFELPTPPVMLEPVALHRLAGRVIADLTNHEAPFHKIEASLWIAEVILATQADLIVEPSAPPTRPLPISVRVRPSSWLGSVMLAALTQGPADVRRCAYRNCERSFHPQPRHRRYCSDACGRKERVYRSRDRWI